MRPDDRSGAARLRLSPRRPMRMGSYGDTRPANSGGVDGLITSQVENIHLGPAVLRSMQAVRPYGGMTSRLERNRRRQAIPYVRPPRNPREATAWMRKRCDHGQPNEATKVRVFAYAEGPRGTMRRPIGPDIRLLLRGGAGPSAPWIALPGARDGDGDPGEVGSRRAKGAPAALERAARALVICRAGAERASRRRRAAPSANRGDTSHTARRSNLGSCPMHRRTVRDEIARKSSRRAAIPAAGMPREGPASARD